MADQSPKSADDLQKSMDIPIAQEKKIFRWLAYLLLVLCVAAVLVWLFIKFTGSMRMAVVLVTFMLGYMGIMGLWASRDHEQRN